LVRNYRFTGLWFCFCFCTAIVRPQNEKKTGLDFRAMGFRLIFDNGRFSGVEIVVYRCSASWLKSHYDFQSILGRLCLVSWKFWGECRAHGMGNGPFDFSWTRNFLILGRWWIRNLHKKNLFGIQLRQIIYLFRADDISSISADYRPQWLFIIPSGWLWSPVVEIHLQWLIVISRITHLRWNSSLSHEYCFHRMNIVCSRWISSPSDEYHLL
jgi:hypothetical protein